MGYDKFGNPERRPGIGARGVSRGYDVRRSAQVEDMIYYPEVIYGTAQQVDEKRRRGNQRPYENNAWRDTQIIHHLPNSPRRSHRRSRYADDVAYGYDVRRQQAQYYGQPRVGAGRRRTQEYGETWRRESSEPDPDYDDLPCDRTGVNCDTGIQEHDKTRRERSEPDPDYDDLPCDRTGIYGDIGRAQMGRTQGYGYRTNAEHIQTGRAAEYVYGDFRKSSPGTRPQEDTPWISRRLPQIASHLYGDWRHMERRGLPEVGDGSVTTEEDVYATLS